jgi:NADPH:quinone reductase
LGDKWGRATVHAITAWEALFDRMDIRKPVAGAAPAVLIIGGAGGVGSIATQLVRTLTNFTVVATASRPETTSWVKDLGARHVIDHGKPIAAQVAALGLARPDSCSPPPTRQIISRSRRADCAPGASSR